MQVAWEAHKPMSAAELETQRARVASKSKSSPPRQVPGEAPSVPPGEALGACCQAPGTIQISKAQRLERIEEPTRQDIQVDLNFHFFQDVFETSR